MNKRTLQRLLPMLVPAGTFCGCLIGLGHLLYSAICAFTRKNFLMSDYGVYTNTIWNLGHGNGFTFLIDHNYLRTHLSFSLVLLSPLFYVWDHPALLIIVQWLFLVAGALVLWRTASRLGVPFTTTSGILFFYCAYPLTQSVLLSEFHGVSAYLVLIPWLVHCLLFRKSLVVIPFLIILGLREDAALLLPLIFIYFAIRDRWRTGYVYAAASFLYCLAAVFWLYPLINGQSLLVVRGGEEPALELFASLELKNLILRLNATAWLLLPLVPFFILTRRGWIPLLVLPAAAYAMAMGSGLPRQYSLTFHYPAAVMACIAAAMPLAAAHADLSGRRTRATALTILLVAATCVAHSQLGFFLRGNRYHHVYNSIDKDGIRALQVASMVPASGRLVCNQRLAAFCANRRDLATWRYWRPDEHPADVFFCRLPEITDSRKAVLLDCLNSGEFGVTCLEIPYVVLVRGARTELNARVKEMVSNQLDPSGQ